MIAVSNTAFEFLRSQKTVEPSTEEFVLKRLRGRCTGGEMLSAFENGISGQYGKVYSLDAATLIGWVEKFLQSKNSAKSYLETGLLNPNEKHFELTNDDWMKEANKCLTSFLNGVSEIHFHPGVYDRMMLDGKIEYNAYLKHYQKIEADSVSIPSDEQLAEMRIGMNKAKQKVLRDVFLTYKSKGWLQVYFIK